METLTRPLAALAASSDALPRVIRQLTAIFLVTPTGDVWRIFDSADAVEMRSVTTPIPTGSTRIFIGSGPRAMVRVYRFFKGEDRSIGAERLFAQLEESRASV